MRALVTGCAGFIGSHLTESLLSDGHEVVGVDCFNDNYQRPYKRRNLELATEWDEFEFIPLDLARGDLLDLLADCDVVFHLAAEPGVRKSWGGRFEQYERNNVLATQHLLDAATRWPEKRFVYASSSSVYGQAEQRPTPETAPTRPLSPYGVTKLAAENLCHLYHANYGVATVSLRYFTVFGPRQRPDMAFHIFCRAALEGQPVTVFDDGTQSRDFTFVKDVVAATRAAGVAEGAELGGVYNIGGGAPATLRHTLDILSDLAGGLEVHYTSRERGDVRDTAAETSRARRDLGFAPQTSLEDGLTAEFEWLRRIVAEEQATRPRSA
jgi:nucleoside-diphosphate-sugar epimerase